MISTPLAALRSLNWLRAFAVPPEEQRTSQAQQSASSLQALSRIQQRTDRHVDGPKRPLSKNPTVPRRQSERGRGETERKRQRGRDPDRQYGFRRVSTSKGRMTAGMHLDEVLCPAAAVLLDLALHPDQRLNVLQSQEQHSRHQSAAVIHHWGGGGGGAQAQAPSSG